MPVRRCPISTDTNNPQSENSQVAEQVNNLLVQGFQAAKEGQRPQAYDLFCDVVKLDPNNEYGWLYRAATTDDMAEAYVCLQRVLSINPSNQKAQRGVERIRARMSGEDAEAGQNQTPQKEAAAVAATASAAQTTPSHQNENEATSNYPAEEGSNPPVNDTGIVSGLQSAGAAYTPEVVQSDQFNDQNNQPEIHQPAEPAQASGYPYPTAENHPGNYDNQTSNNYLPVETASYATQEPQSENGQSRFYQPTPIEDNQNRFYQPVEETGYQPNNYQTGSFQPEEYHPDNYPSDNYQASNYPSNNYQPDNYSPNENEAYPNFMTTPVGDDGPAVNSKNNRGSKRDSLKAAGIGAGLGAATAKADKPKRSRGFGRKEEAPLIATFGTEPATDLDEVGKTRSEKLQRRAAIILLILAILVFLVAGIVFIQRNSNNNAEQQAANATSELVPPPSTPSTDANATPLATDANGSPIASTAAANATTSGNLANGGTNASTDTAGAVGTAAPVNNTTVAGNNTQAAGQDTTTQAPQNTTTQAPQNTTTQAPQTQTTAAATTASVQTTNAAPSALKPIAYTVVNGDNLTNLARKFGTSIPAIVAANKGNYTLDPSGRNLFAGNKIIIPVSRANFTGKGGVITKAGDTLDSIANQFKVTKEDLMKFNGLANESDFKPGDALLIP